MEDNRTMETLVKQYAKYISDINPYHNSEILESFDGSLDDYTEYFDEITEKWFNTFNEELGGIPKEYLYSIKKPENEEETYEVIKLVSLNLIILAPRFFVDYLSEIEYTKPCVKNILQDDVIAKPYNEVYNDKDEYEAFEIYRQAVVLSQAYEDLVDDLLEGIKKCHPANDNILEYIVESLVTMQAFDKVIGFLNDIDEIDMKYLNLLHAITKHKSDDTYRCLRRCFKSINDDSVKHIVVYMLADYGDSRAVPLLRKYAIDLRDRIVNSTEMSEEERKEQNWYFFSVVNTIEQMGGNVEDLKIF